ncbi:hypothetical protein ACIRA0001_2009 [Acinetobacter radioresistens SK82]|uniref:Uncharacterized protein n=1 Tax=Acinetobacter radioresistens SK82 TaxID=596318 RepID=A0ABP2GJH9_ACIRA|nr:hypothetical protein ACIRA0001_2009 [Acinetobacter radioresistens SK82]EXE59873.1 hypothetical protein J579_0633 [Acinetobacter sp. 1239920]
MNKVPKPITKFFTVEVTEAHVQSILPTAVDKIALLIFGVKTSVFLKASVGKPTSI